MKKLQEDSTMTTQSQVNAVIQRFMAKAINAEVKRDRAKFESPEYWNQHDIAVKWHKKAEALMPR